MSPRQLFPHQIEGIHRLRQDLLSRKPSALIAPPRTGKSHIIRIAAYELQLDGLIACTLALSVNEILARQFTDRMQWHEALQMRGITPKTPVLIKLLETRSNLHDPAANGELFLSATIQLATLNRQTICEWITSMVHRVGVPPMIVFDECHQASIANTWGETLEAFRQAGAFLVLMTGTPNRANGVRLAGFEYETREVEPVQRVITRPGKDPEHIRVDIYEGIRSIEVLRTPPLVDLREAWGLNLICHIDRSVIDVRDEIGQQLGELKGPAARAALARSVRDPVVISEGLRQLVQRLRVMRAIQPEARAIVFCGSDEIGDAESNRHAKDIRRLLKESAPGLRAVIATSTEGRGAAVVNEFKTLKGADVLIVKQMASLGLDIPALKVGLDLSPTRTAAAYIQRMMRIATPWEGIKICMFITPDDCLSAALFESIVVSAGGDARSYQLELLRSEERERKDPPLPPEMFDPAAADLAGFDDTRRNRADAFLSPKIERFYQVFPMVASMMTHAEVGVRLQLYERAPGVESGADVLIQDTSLTETSLREEANELVTAIVNKRRTGGDYDQTEWVALVKDTWTRTYRRASIPRGLELGHLNIDQLRRVVATLHAWQ